MTGLGLFACIVVAILPPTVHASPMIAVGAAVGAAFCAAGLLLPLLGLAVAGAVAAMLAFTSALFAEPEVNASAAGVLLGVSIWIVLACTYFRQRFRAMFVEPAVQQAHMVALGAWALVSAVAAALLAVTAFVVPAIPNPYARALLPGAGAILVMGGVLLACRPAVPGRPARRPQA